MFRRGAKVVARIAAHTGCYRFTQPKTECESHLPNSRTN